jgi:hydroxymethylpyrimidine/phosphomethylpyrimidine kinase
VQVVNRLYGEQGEMRSDAWQRLPGSYHGSGCTLASALAATLANGLPVEEAVRDAQEYTWQTLKAGFRPGMGQFIPDRLFWARETDEDAATADDTGSDPTTADAPEPAAGRSADAAPDSTTDGLPPARAAAH